MFPWTSPRNHVYNSVRENPTLQGLVSQLRALWHKVNSFDFSPERIGRFLSPQPVLG